jgi:aldose 1-epimerase
MPDGAEISLYTLTGPLGMRVKVMALGATLTEVRTPDARGTAANVVLGFDHLEPYLTRPSYLGATIGRVANRIAGSKFMLDGHAYTLNANNGGIHHLHGGPRGFDKLVWRSRALPATAAGAAVEFTLLSPDGDENYPGNLRATVIYTLTADGALRLDYSATTDRPTSVNLTNHTFFNLAGSGDILDHRLTLNAARYTPVDAAKIPTGELAPVAGTDFDFSTAQRIGGRLRGTGPVAAGYDHNYVLNGAAGQLAFCARLADPVSGRVMEVWTTEPGVQFNTGNSFDGRFTGANGQPIEKHAGCALETQHFPDSVNRPQFPSVILRPGGTFRSTTELRFSVAP